jgi:excisionase family DNA binding protein
MQYTSSTHSDHGPLLVGPKDACRLLSCGNTRLYELLNSREIASFRDGRSRKIVVSSIKDYIDRHLAAAYAADKNNNPAARATKARLAKKGDRA